MSNGHVVRTRTVQGGGGDVENWERVIRSEGPKYANNFSDSAGLILRFKLHSSRQPSGMFLRGLSQSQRCMWTTNRCRFFMAKKLPTVSDYRTASTSTRPSGTGSDGHHAHCKDFVQKHDYEAYLVSQLYPVGKRGGYFAIKAFYVCL